MAEPSCLVVLVTCESLQEGRVLADALLQARAAACVNIVGGIESHYRWEGKLESAAEYLLMIKTTESQTGQVEEIVKQNHSYDIPEIVCLPITGGEPRYLSWLRGAVVALVAVLSLVAQCWAASYEELVKQLGHNDPEMRADAADGLTALGGDQVTEKFREMLSSSNPERRQLAAIGLLQVSETAEDLEKVRRLLADDVTIVRWSAVLALGESGDAKCLPWLQAAAVEDRSASVREAAEEAIAKLEALIPWQRSLPDALNRAGEQQQPVLVYFRLPRSAHCQVFEAGVLQDARVVDAAQGFIPVRINAAAEPATAQPYDAYDVRGVPTVILLDPRGNEMRRIAGLVDVDGLLRHLNEARRSPYTFREARRSAARDPSNVRANWKVAEAYLGDGREELAEPYLRNIIAHDEPNRYGHTDNAMFALGFLLGRKGKYGRAIYCLETLLERWPRFKDRDKALYVLGVSQLARGNTQQGRQTLARLQDEFPGSNAANAARKSVQAMPPERKNN